MPLDASILGRLLLMQSVLNNLPDEAAIQRFIERGMLDLPGVGAAKLAWTKGLDSPPAKRIFPLTLGDQHLGELVLAIKDSAAFEPYAVFIANFCFMAAVIFEERRKRAQLADHQHRLEERVTERTKELVLQIAERRRVETALRAQEAFLKALLEAVPTPIFYRDVQGRYLGVNKHFEDFLGKGRNDILGKTVFELIPHELASACQAIDKELLAGEARSHTFPATFVPAAGGARECLFSKAVFFGEDGLPAGIIGAINDVTELKRGEAELILSRDRANAANKSKSEFLANMSHEIRTPISGLMNMLRLLKGQPLDREGREYLDGALQSGARLTRILSDVLDLARVEAGKLSLSAEPFCIGDVLTSVQETFGPSMLGSETTLTIVPPMNTPEVLVGDEVRVRQILFNVVGNAVKFTERGSVVLSVWAKPRPGGKSVTVFFAVKDTGIGIHPEKLDKVLEPFTQADSKFSKKHQGVGLGLAITTQLIALMAGQLEVVSLPGQGTTVTAAVPLDLAEAGSPSAGEMNGACLLPPPQRILIVEDERLNRLGMVRLLAQMGHFTAEAENGQKALAMLAEHEFDCVLMDIQMPVMDGLETTQAIRRSTTLGAKSAVPIIAVTAYAMAGDKEQFLSAGMDGYVSKPVDLATLQKVIAEVLEIPRLAACGESPAR